MSDNLINFPKYKKLLYNKQSPDSNNYTIKFKSSFSNGYLES